MKPIKLTASSLAKAQQQLTAQLNNLRLQGTKINFSYDLEDVIKEQLEKSNVKKPIIYMMANTYLKMLEYVLKCDTEIAWHGTVKRGEGDKKHIFFIKDVYLYPQKISAATVQVDDTKYTQWSDGQDADSFNNRRFQGHSHVNMSTFYSSTDENNKNEFLQDLLDDDYYIFLVTNKKQEHNFELYDLAQNIIFENKDIDFRVYLDENTILDSIDDEMNKQLTKPTYTLPTYNYMGFGSKQETKKKQYGFFDDELDYYTGYKKALKVKRHVVILNRTGRVFTKEYPEYKGDVIENRFNGQDYKVFVPYIPFEAEDVSDLRKDGWHVREMPVPEEYV